MWVGGGGQKKLNNITMDLFHLPANPFDAHPRLAEQNMQNAFSTVVYYTYSNLIGRN